MKFFTILSTLIFAVVSVSASCPIDDCECQSPTGCPGQCIQSSNTGPLCAGYCGDTGAQPCAACAGQGNNKANCLFDTTGTVCSLIVE
ncbi:hypothetical protein BDY19DRAFT_965152 [Irpex rosettiformis]|uniref:Uncharacterized protein n=1 Tax=Irpex rosettiformis TaxID=378272 RepID=A0ACB8TUJ4_9APHY|nr:hypothetical protein BDY19DRAFT_965152 [Irpex rosettiformis]